MASKRYNIAVWIVAGLMAVAFAYYFITVIFLGGWRYFQPKVKLTAREKEMIKEFRSECNCEVRLQHNYYLINNNEGNHFNSSDSAINISFTNSPDKTILPCGYSDSILIAHATDVATRMVKTISYRNYYVYYNVVYSSFRKGDMQSTCYKSVKFKLTKNNNFEFVRID